MISKGLGFRCIIFPFHFLNTKSSKKGVFAMEEKRESKSSEETQTVSEGRRKLLKVLAASGGAFVAATLLPEKWVKPVIDWGVLPLHAQTSPGVDVFFLTWSAAPLGGGGNMQKASPAQGQVVADGFPWIGTAAYESSACLSLGNTSLGLMLKSSGSSRLWDKWNWTLQELITAGILVLSCTPDALGGRYHGSMIINFDAMGGDTSVDIGLYTHGTGMDMMGMNLISNILNALLGSVPM
jgi:hypothetical protein